ncbi:MAG: glycosyltransferase [Castellaniella sp.]|uniref:glycosyltransferase n=1 Tax=Castellaniella sp. TaxID=1955812 RepID=UPI003C75C238
MVRNIVSIIGIDSFEKKNINQINAIRTAGLTAHVVSTDNYGVSALNLNELGLLFRLKKNIIYRLFQVLFYFLSHVGRIKHVEIYPGGRFALIYVIFAKIFFNKILVVERGDLYYYDRADYLTRLSQRLCYGWADVVWYREYYPGIDVEAVLSRLGARKIVFIHNAIDSLGESEADESHRSFNERDIDFLWVNTFKEFRHPDWLLCCLSEEEFSGKKAVLMGVDKKIIGVDADRHHAIAAGVASQSIEIKERDDPVPLYQRAKYFILASDLVFLNNALLEAMSYGVVPIVSDVVGADSIVQDGMDGYLFRNECDGLKEAMLRAAENSEEIWRRLSLMAREKVAQDFSLETWNFKYINMINAL